MGRHERPSINYKVIIPYTCYIKIKPQIQLRVRNTTIKTREVLKLQKGWVDVFLDYFYEQHGLPCSYAMKYHHVSSQSCESYISFKGKCTDQSCRAVMFGDISRVPEPGENVNLNILTVNTIDIKHNTKRFLREPKRSIISQDVLNNGLYKWQRITADQSMYYGDAVPPNIYDSTMLRKAKQQYMDKSLGINGTNPIDSLISLKYEMKHNGTIHHISSDPFFVHYWLPIQQHIYKTKLKKNWNTICVDATGSLVLPIIRTKNKIPSAHIFLYQIITEVEGKTVPISQQLSEKQDMMTIYYWLFNWINTGMTIPNECVCDYSKALLGAITRTFYKRKSLQEYIDTCFSF